MKYLLDVNVLLALNWNTHPHHTRATAWITGKQVSVCPIAELGFLRISTNKKAFNLPMDDARQLLQEFLKTQKASQIVDDLPALDAKPKTSDQVTDAYLSALAQKHGLKLATFDEGIPSAEVIA
jgi:toxin-antitoxin system PIN domain toxin